MSQGKSERMIAVEIIEQVEQGAYLNICLNSALKGYDRTRRKFITALVYTTLENLIRIDYVIDSFVTAKKIHHFVRNVLRVGVCQLLYFESVPTSAAVNESVKVIASSKKRQLKGFCNAVLRNISDNLGEISYPDEDENPVKFLSVMYSYPEWIVEKYLQEYGYDFTWDMLSYSRTEPVTCVRPNLSRISKEELIERLKAEDLFSHEGNYSRNAVYIKNINQIEDHYLFREGLIAIQGESSMLVCETPELEKGMKVLDLCAAPGGKSAYIKVLQETDVISFDIHPHRVQLMDQLFSRLGLEIRTGINDATARNEELLDGFDVVMVDAPCSALGLLYRKPDIKYRKEKEDLKKLSDTEYRIIENAAEYVKKGGELIYSTCTIDKEENDMVVERFLNTHPGFSLGELGGLPESLQQRAKSGSIQLFPHLDRIDGFYIAKLLRNE